MLSELCPNASDLAITHSAADQFVSLPFHRLLDTFQQSLLDGFELLRYNFLQLR